MEVVMFPFNSFRPRVAKNPDPHFREISLAPEIHSSGVSPDAPQSFYQTSGFSQNSITANIARIQESIQEGGSIKKEFRILKHVSSKTGTRGLEILCEKRELSGSIKDNLDAYQYAEIKTLYLDKRQLLWLNIQQNYSGSSFLGERPAVVVAKWPRGIYGNLTICFVNGVVQLYPHSGDDLAHSGEWVRLRKEVVYFEGQPRVVVIRGPDAPPFPDHITNDNALDYYRQDK